MAAEAARRVEHARAGRGPRVAEDPVDLRLGRGLGFEALRNLGPRLLEEALTVEHGSHYTQNRVSGAAEWCIKVRGARNAGQGERRMATLVTGAFGCIGAGVVKRLLAAGVGPPTLYGPGPITDDSPPKPATHYGIYKVANEETARVYWEEYKIPSMGFRPLSVYGPGRDFGVTAD